MAHAPQVADGAAENACLARTGPQEPEQQLHRGGFASPVWSEEPEHLTTRHGHRQTREGDCPAEFLRQVDGLDRGRTGGRPLRGGPYGLFFYISPRQQAIKPAQVRRLAMAGAY